MKRTLWRTRFGFYLAAIGSAFGLGNVWRFPYVVAENGGGAFVLLYVALVFVVGLPLLIGELMVGKVTRRSIISAMEVLGRQDHDSTFVTESRSFHNNVLGRYFLKHAYLIGRLAVILSLLVLAYFAVISGWVLHFLMQFLVGSFTGDINAEAALAVLRENGWLQVLLTSVHLLFVVVIVAKDVDEGIERWVGYMMPVFVALLMGLAFKSLSLDATPEALRFFLYPDFSRLDISSLGHALGHVLFTLSIGFGMMVTFGSYLKEKSYIPIAGFRVATLDSFISLFAGLLIFPLVVAQASRETGPELLFQTVPVLLTHIQGGAWFGIGFFLCLYLAALGASIGLLEAVVSNLRDSDRINRQRGAWIVGGICLLVAVMPALSSSTLSNVRYGNKGLLQIFDVTLINWLLPIVALGISQMVCYRLDEKVKRAEFEEEEGPSAKQVYGHWIFALRFIVPLVIITALILQLVGLVQEF